ncbi:4Fe-4S dicluster domain-containing protein [Dehalobacter sp. DCM]|uniref:4Fe-4S dicluster domain-containing protein n=1 Tax=Dehalobacter sp. DCM TaxID=2907827 RepID=UPI003081A82B|nr:4Fe-4S dicluster domain-containing protein [Dehalobacter sp. DCM]
MSNYKVAFLSDQADPDLVERLEGCRAEAKKCYQCGKCSAGCPVAFAMDKTPREIMRYLQNNMLEEALNSHTIWLCATCLTCSERCPQEVNIAEVMESLRILAGENRIVAERRIDIFHQMFLKYVEEFGRVYELGLILGSNLVGLQPFKDVQFGLPIFTRGKIDPFPPRIESNTEVKKIFENVRRRGGNV